MEDVVSACITLLPYEEQPGYGWHIALHLAAACKYGEHCHQQQPAQSGEWVLAHFMYILVSCDFKLVKKFLRYRILLVPAYQNTCNQMHWLQSFSTPVTDTQSPNSRPFRALDISWSCLQEHEIGSYRSQLNPDHMPSQLITIHFAVILPSMSIHYGRSFPI